MGSGTDGCGSGGMKIGRDSVGGIFSRGLDDSVMYIGGSGRDGVDSTKIGGYSKRRTKWLR